MAHPTSTGVYTRDSTTFPPTETFSGWNHPTRYEADIISLEIEGKLPQGLYGAFFRVQPDCQFPPMFEDDVPINGDGNVAHFIFKDGHVDFKNRYVKTPKFVVERKARKALIGRYRNRYTDDPLVKDILTRTTSNTNVVWHAGRLLALKEDGPPFQLDPVTLETIGVCDFNGKYKAPTFTAHPKFDDRTGEMLCYGYEAKGDATRDVAYYSIGKDGAVAKECWFQVPWTSMMHDFFVTENYIIFPISPLKASLEQMKAGGEHFYYDEKLDHQMIGILPRHDPKEEDMKWYKTPAGMWVHTINGYEDKEGNIVLEASIWNHCLFPFFPNSEGLKKSVDPSTLRAPVFRFRFHPSESTKYMLRPEKLLMDGLYEFGRVDDRYLTREHKNYWILSSDTTKFQDEAATVKLWGGMNVLTHHNVETDKVTTWWPGVDITLQEPCFVPRYRGSPQDDGYLIVLADIWASMTNDLLIFEALDIGKGPVATVHLPLRLRGGLHGNWVDGDEFLATVDKLQANGKANGHGDGLPHSAHPVNAV